MSQSIEIEEDQWLQDAVEEYFTEKVSKELEKKYPNTEDTYYYKDIKFYATYGEVGVRWSVSKMGDYYNEKTGCLSLTIGEALREFINAVD
jgi:hypothetical protein